MNGAPAYGIILLLALLLLWAYWPILPGLVAQWWNEEDYSHGFLIPVISLGIIWYRRERLRITPVSSSWWGLLPISAALLLYMAGIIGADLFLQRMSLIGMIIGLVVFFLGWSFFQALLFPLGYLILAIPLPGIVFNSIAFPLQMFAAKVATAMMQTVSIPVFREGNVMHLSSISLDVERACSGIRSLITLLALGILFAYWKNTRRSNRLLLIASVVPIAIAANVVRVTATGFVAHFLSAEAAQDFFHTIGGLLVFAVAAGLFFSLSGVLGSASPES